MKISFLFIALLCNNFFFTERSIFLTNKGKVSFESNAPLELIKAKSFEGLGDLLGAKECYKRISVWDSGFMRANEKIR